MEQIFLKFLFFERTSYSLRSALQRFGKKQNFKRNCQKFGDQNGKSFGFGWPIFWQKKFLKLFFFFYQTSV